MIRAYVIFCYVAHPAVCLPKIEITPIDHAITSPMECARGGFILEAQKQNPKLFAKVRCEMEGDGSDIVQKWVEDQKARAERLEPQIK